MVDISQGLGAAPRLCFVFAPGSRPDLAALDALAGVPSSAAHTSSAATSFFVSHRSPDGTWAELLLHGLTFDCTGLAPGDSDAQPAAGPPVGLRSMPAGEIVSLAPAPHLAGGAGLIPVLQVIAKLGANLAALSGVLAVTWTPAGSWVAPDLFRRAIAVWLDGGAFPGLILTALEQKANGALVSRGLQLLIGQELYFEPDKRLPPATLARLAVRMIHELVQIGPLQHERDFTGPGGERLLAVPVRDGTELRILVSGLGSEQ